MPNSKENILERLREALNHETIDSFDINASQNFSFVPPHGNICEFFKNEIEKISGNCLICQDKHDFIIQLKNILKTRNLSNILCKDDLISVTLNYAQIPFFKEVTNYDEVQVAITPCDFLSARTGSVVISSSVLKEREIQIFAPIHFVIAEESQLLFDLDIVMDELEKKYSNNYPSQISIITGQSRTADIEKTLILGAHGPKEIFVFLIQN